MKTQQFERPSKEAYLAPTVWSETIVIEKGFATTPGTAPELDENEFEGDL
jgi:hypothetical protein